MKKSWVSSEKLASIIDEQTTVFWFRRDLRVDDNSGLYHALRESKNVVPIFIFDTAILDQLDDRADARVSFIHDSLLELKKSLEVLGSSLLILHGEPLSVYRDLKCRIVYANDDYEPYALKRDEAIANLLHARGSKLKLFKDHVIFEKKEVTKDSGEPYTVFTPYSKKWKAKLNPFFLKSYPVIKYSQNFKKLDHQPFPGLDDIGFKKSAIHFPERVIKKEIIRRYHQTRDIPSESGTSRLSVHLRFGTVSIRKLAKLAADTNETWLNELIWRDFYQMILVNFPHVVRGSFKPAYDRIEWRNNTEEFEAWCEGRTGYPIVDAGMRELNSTGFMHNRVRMITASFLTKHLLIDWRWGEAYFAKKLLDYDLASNNGGWQWAAGSGCDAAPYFRVFNPELQTAKFDPNHRYIKRWVPEFGTQDYPAPIVDHRYARDRALKVYGAGLEKK